MIGGQESEGIDCCHGEHTHRGEHTYPPRLLYPPPHQKPGRRGSNLATEIQRGGGYEVPGEFEISS